MTFKELTFELNRTKRVHNTNRGASEEELTLCEKKIGMRLPPSFREFLKNWDGGTFYESEDILGTKDPTGLIGTLTDVTKRLRSNTKFPLPKNLIPFHFGLGNHVFDASLVDEHDEYAVVEMDLNSGQVLQRYKSFLDWFERHLLREYTARYQ